MDKALLLLPCLFVLAFTAAESRRLAKASKDASQSRRLPALAAALAGMRWEDAARIDGIPTPMSQRVMLLDQRHEWGRR